jgi:hypothetical protein
LKVAEKKAWADSDVNAKDLGKKLKAANVDQKLDKLAMDLEGALKEVEGDYHSNGYYHGKRAGPIKLWAVGATAQKTATLNAKMMKMARLADALGQDPVYGPFIEHHQQILLNDVMVAATKYDKTMQDKYMSDPVFKQKCDNYVDSLKVFGNEAMNEDGWTFEDNDGSLQKAGAEWEQW